jgi:4-amino-4-deoxy-L-arabinose transferase-like glycosyltransferase
MLVVFHSILRNLKTKIRNLFDKLTKEPLISQFLAKYPLIQRFFTNKNNYIYIILFVAFLLRFGAFLSFQPWDAKTEKEIILVTDAKCYHDLALCIMEGNYRSETFWAPGFPAWIALIYSIFGIKPWIVLLINGLISVSSVYILFKIASALFSNRIAQIASLLLAFDPHQITYSQTFYSDTVFLILFLSSVLFFVRFIKLPQLRYLIFSAIFLGISVYFRPIATYLFIVPIILLFIFGGKGMKIKFRNIIIFLAFLQLVILPWVVRNYLLYEKIGFATNGGYNLLHVYAASIYNNQFGMNPEITKKMLEKDIEKMGGDRINNPFVLDSLQKAYAFDIIRTYPMEYIYNHMSGMMNMYTSLSSYHFSNILHIPSYLQSVNFHGVPHYKQLLTFWERKHPLTIFIGVLIVLLLTSNYFLAIVGLYSMYKNKIIFPLILIIGFILYFTFLVGVLGSSARFKLPITPFYLILSAYGINYLYEKWKLKKVS